MEREEESIEVSLIYNGEKIQEVVVKPQHWFNLDLGKYENAKSLLVTLNGKTRNSYFFDEYREDFKEVSFRDF